MEQSLSFYFLGKFWKCCSIIQCFLSLLQTNISKYLKINQRISQKAPCQGLINVYQLHMTIHYQSFDDVWEVRGVFLNPIQDGLFRGCSRMGRGGTRVTIPKIYHTYPAMMKLGTVIPYLKKIQKIYKSRDTPPEFC